ncbi:MAG: DEAD/DEAH box helicase, partial [Thermoplasmata archaeon]|nr:DEAD/DEAH box helicase [Thermoplasmata archaeon]
MKSARGVVGVSEGEFWRALDPLLGRYFRERFTAPTEAQERSLKALRQGKDLLVVSPTGTGKTFTAFLTVLDHLVNEAREGRLQEKTYCVYISPLKALGNDIRRNLQEPLEAVYELAKEEGVALQEIRVAIRTGDTLIKERQRHLRHPPHILITTPESLVLLLSSSHQRYLKEVNYVIADELHSLLPTKRGTMLAVALQWLDHLNHPRKPLRIGLSATLSNPKEAMKFLLGYEDSRWKRGEIIEGKMSKKYSFEVRYTPSWGRLLEEVGEIINNHKVTMVFTGRRREAEEISYYLKAKGFTDLYPHHGSLSREVREEVEALLKRGELRAVITSTSLELGIDIGDVDVVVQISPPPSPSALLQRVGRAGHGIGRVSKGIILARTRHEILEAATLVEMAKKGILERISIPQKPWDVAIQMITAMATGGVEDVKDIHKILSNSYPFRRLKMSLLKKIVTDLASLSRHSVKLMDRFTLKEGGGKVQVKKGFKHIFYTNVGTIVPEIKYAVYTSSPLRRVGELSEEFVERLSKYDVFMLGGKSYQLLEIRGRRAIVREVEGLLAMAPRWSGEAPSRPPEVSDYLSKTLQYISEEIEKHIKDRRGEKEVWPPLMKQLSQKYGLDESSSEELFYYVLSLMNHKAIPLKGRVVYERVKGPAGSSFALYYPSTQATMRALSHMIRFIYRRDFGYLSRTTVANDGFIMTLPGGLPTPHEILSRKEDLGRWKEEGIKSEEVYILRLKNVLFRSLFLLKSYRGKPVGPRKIQNDFRLFKSLLESDGLGTLGRLLQEEALKEVTMGPLDIEEALNLREVLVNSATEVVEAISPSPLLKELFEGGEYVSTEEELHTGHTITDVSVKDVGERTVEVPDEVLEDLIKEFAESVLRGDPPAPITVRLNDKGGRRREVIANLSQRLRRAGRTLKAIRIPGGYVLLPPGLEGVWKENIEGAT